MCHVILYNICHVLLYNMCHVMLYNIYSVMLCYLTCHVTLYYIVMRGYCNAPRWQHAFGTCSALLGSLINLFQGLSLLLPSCKEVRTSATYWVSMGNPMRLVHGIFLLFLAHSSGRHWSASSLQSMQSTTRFQNSANMEAQRSYFLVVYSGLTSRSTWISNATQDLKGWKTLK